MNQLISIEGIDGSGKTTLVDKLGLLGFTIFKEIPKSLDEVSSKSGKEIRSLLQVGDNSPEFRLMLANKYVSLRAEYQDRLKELLKENTVIIDRGILSTLVYGYVDDENADLLYKANSSFLQPDITFYLDIDIDIALKRLNGRGGVGEAYKKREVMVKNMDTYNLLINRYDFNICRIDANNSASNILRKVLNKMETN